MPNVIAYIFDHEIVHFRIPCDIKSFYKYLIFGLKDLIASVSRLMKCNSMLRISWPVRYLTQIGKTILTSNKSKSLQGKLRRVLKWCANFPVFSVPIQDTTPFAFFFISIANYALSSVVQLRFLRWAFEKFRTRRANFVNFAKNLGSYHLLF